MWYEERICKHRDTTNLKFQLCYGNGKVQLPILKSVLLVLQHLLYDTKVDDSMNYHKNIRLYNMMFSFTSPGANFDNSVLSGKGLPIIRIQGQTCHRIGSLIPSKGKPPKYTQLYIYDPENEISNRILLVG